MDEDYDVQNNLNIPTEELGRQAVDSLRGYIYQIYQSINAWLRIKEEETLLLEVAEDYAVLAKHSLTSTQVRDTRASGSITLRSNGIIATITSLRRYQKVNPDKSIHINYLTTSNIGRERQLSFPGNSKGLEYWRIAAREGNDVEPIRKALLSLDLPEEVIEFVGKASPEDLQNQLLRRIKWIYGAEDIGELDQIIDDRLVNLGEKQGLTPSDVERVRYALVVAVLQKIVDKKNRALNRADLLRIFEKSVAVSIPMPALRKLLLESRSLPINATVGQMMSSANIVVNASQIPFPPRLVYRYDLVNRFKSSTGLSSVLWLYGSSGVGKTIMAQLIANLSKRDWWYVPLRDCTGAQLNFRLRNVQYSLDSGDLGGLILDDFPLTYAGSARMSLSMLAIEILSRDGIIIVIADKPPPPSVENCFGKDAPHIEKVPYFSRSEIAEMVKNSGGDPKKWAGIIYTFCGMGHPQLVDARISGLRRRGWPDRELFDGFGSFGGPATEVEYEREIIRSRLIDEVPDDAREMLYRLALVMGDFDRELAFAIGGVHPAIPSPGEMLDILVGPWIEMRANDRFRVSPLVSDSGDKNLNKTIKSHVHQQIVDDLLTRHPFPAEYLGPLLGHALISRHEHGLSWLAMAVLNTRHEDRKMMAEHLLLLTLLDAGEDKPLFPESMLTSAMLRLAQFKVTVAANETKQLEILADRLIAEARLIEPKEILENFLYAAISTVLMERTLKIRPKKWMPLLLELEEHLAGDKNLARLARGLDPVKEGLKDWDIPQFMFANRSTALAGIDDLTELFTVLDDLTPERRDYMLSSFQDPYLELRFMIQSAWLAEHRKGQIDGATAAEKYRELTEIAEGWENTDLAIECECSRAIMLDEYAHDKEGALNAIAEAEKKYPNDIRLARRRAKVLYRSGDHPAALAAIEPIMSQLPKKDNIERAHAFREAGISAAETGDVKKASQLFYEGYKSAIESSDILLPMAAGLLADCAILEFKAGDYRTTVKYMIHALTEAENINPEKALNERFCIRVLGHTIMWMQSQLTDKDFGFDFQVVHGCCSNPDPHEDIMKMETPPKLILWYQLAELEANLGVDEGVKEQLRERTKLKKHISSEIMLSFSLLARYIREKDTDLFFAYLPEYVGKYAYWVEHKDILKAADLHTFESMEFVVPESDDWSKEPYIEIATNAVLAFSISLLCSDNFDVTIHLSSNLDKITGLNEAISPFLECFEKQLSLTGKINELAAASIGKLANRNSGINTDDLFLITCHLWSWLTYSHFKDLIGKTISEHLVERWRNVIENQRFLLKQPMINVPTINDAINSDLKGIAKMAKIALAAENAVVHRLSNEMRLSLKKSIKA